MAVEVSEEIDTSEAENMLEALRGVIAEMQQVTACGFGIRVWSRPPTPKSVSVRVLGSLRYAFCRYSFVQGCLGFGYGFI